jgi:hypothetical protein
MDSEKPMTMRGVNFWPHGRNWYEMHSLADNQRLLEDIASMGFSDFCTTFERWHLRNYLDERAADHTSRELWRTLRELGRRAHDLGMTVTALDSLHRPVGRPGPAPPAGQGGAPLAQELDTEALSVLPIAAGGAGAHPARSRANLQGLPSH